MKFPGQMLWTDTPGYPITSMGCPEPMLLEELYHLREACASVKMGSRSYWSTELQNDC